MKRLFIALAVLASAISLSSCEEIIEFNGKYDGEKLVLFSCANPDASVFTVSLSRSRFFLDDSQDERPYDITGGKVTLTVDGKTVNMTEDSRMPGTFRTDLVPKVGSRVLLNATADGLAPVSAETVVPARVRFTVVPEEPKVVDDSEWGIRVERHFRITIHDEADERNYYRFSVVKDGSDDPYYTPGKDDEAQGGSMLYIPTYLMTNDVAFMRSGDFDAVVDVIEGESVYFISGLYDDSFFNGRDYTFDAWIEDYIWKYEPSYGGGHESEEPREIDPYDISGWGIEVDSVSEDLYRYQSSRDDYRNYDAGLGSIFGEPVSIHNNIRGGIGCLGALTPSLVMF